MSTAKNGCKCDSSTVGSTPPCQGGGREFEPRLSLSATRVAKSLVYRSRQRGLPNSLINAIVVQLVVRHLAKVEVASSSLVYRSQGTEDLGSFFLHNSELCAEREPAAAVYCSTVFYTIISLSNALIACKKFVNIIQCSRQANGRNAPH